MADYIVVHSVKVATDFVPETFGRLTTIGPKFLLHTKPGAGRKIKRIAYQVCQCTCGNTVAVRHTHLSSGLIVSCKCSRGSTSIRHGLTNSEEYRLWNGMKTRCYNENRDAYKNYGGRGIRVCDRWLDPENGFLNFLEDMGERPYTDLSIDRIDVNGNYCPENCRWATLTEQSRNKRTNRNYTAFGKTQCLLDWAAEYCISYSTLRCRLAKGMPIEDALTVPVRGSQKHATD